MKHLFMNPFPLVAHNHARKLIIYRYIRDAIHLGTCKRGDLGFQAILVRMRAGPGAFQIVAFCQRRSPRNVVVSLGVIDQGNRFGGSRVGKEASMMMRDKKRAPVLFMSGQRRRMRVFSNATM